MRVMASRKGFSLVELLTVIAIIAILASIIFPVMSMVNQKARMNKCITQLHQIGLGVQMFKQDNRRYPDILATSVQKDTGGNVIPFDRTGADKNLMGLWPEYVRSSKLFHCPSSKYIDTSAVEQDPASGIWFYPYDSYDFVIMKAGDVRRHYTRSWVVLPSGTTDPAGPVQNYIADRPPLTGDAAADYERQLKFRTPPDNTVITWCSSHESISGSGTGGRATQFGGRAPILYLDGHVDQMQAQDVEELQYRLLPKKE